MKKIFCFTVILLSCSCFAAFAADGKDVYTKLCAGCHGADGTKSTGGSPQLKGQSSHDLMAKMEGYKAKTYGSKQKAIMENIVNKVNPEELKGLIEYISKL